MRLFEALGQVLSRLEEHGASAALLGGLAVSASGRLATARLLPPGETEEGIIVDLLFASSGIEPEIVDAAANVDIGAPTTVRVARIGHLVALKLLSQDSARPQDALDLNALKTVLDPEEQRRAHQACDLIVRRGYHRGRDLRALLATFLAAQAGNAPDSLE